jgi:hypothetical protein
VAGDLEAARRELTQRVIGQRGVSGTAVGEHGGKPCLKVYVTDREAERSVPKSVGGYPVVVETTGKFERL